MLRLWPGWRCVQGNNVEQVEKMVGGGRANEQAGENYVNEERERRERRLLVSACSILAGDRDIV